MLQHVSHGLETVRRVVFSGLLLAVIVWLLVSSPIPQCPSYHDFADRRPCRGIPNCSDVLSNICFVFAGAVGTVVVVGRKSQQTLFEDPWEKGPYIVFFVGAILMAIGSGYYHLSPDNGRLVWDRLTMTVVFGSLLTTVIAERKSLAMARRLFVPLLVLGAASVWYWSWSEQLGTGDLRPYGLVHFGSMALIVVLIALYPAHYGGTGYLAAMLVAAVIAKICEAADKKIFAVGNVVSGHTLKHFAAAAGVACMAAMLQARAPSLAKLRRDK
jgi:hypothetical protein